MRIDLVWLAAGDVGAPSWSLGRTHLVPPHVRPLSDLIEKRLLSPRPAASTSHILFWSAALGRPPEAVVANLAQSPVHAWHCGLLLGTAGQPRLIDFVAPVWRFNRDGNAHRVVTSWRLSLAACLVSADVLRYLGGPDPGFETLRGAALEMGHRWLARGALIQHTPQLLAMALSERPSPVPPTLADEFHFVRSRFGDIWARWALLRALATGRERRRTLAGYSTARRRPLAPQPAPLPGGLESRPESGPDVSVLIPTLDRYPYLFRLLDQLRQQTMPPQEIIVVDQTETARRQSRWPEKYADLPLRVIWRDRAGQCSSRNAGLQVAAGSAILFLDDDDEIPPDLIATHLALLDRYDADASCGVADEKGAGPLPSDFTYVRASDVFPTNNTLLRRSALRASGLFDLAYERGERADGDLGMRLYLVGKMLVLNPAARVVHWHAGEGGLRQHRARVATRAGSRGSLSRRHLLAPTEAYLWWRYFRPDQVREALLIRTLSTLRSQGHLSRRGARFLLMLILLPFTWRANSKRLRRGRQLLAQHPIIPTLLDS